jgi:hypothetical protein
MDKQVRRAGDESYEILLLLCCLTGAVAFICFATCAVNLGTAMGKDAELTPELLARGRDSLLAVRLELNQTVRELAAKEEATRARLAADSASLGNPDDPARPQRRLEQLRQRRDELAKELGRVGGASPEQAKELQAVERRIDSAQSQLASIEQPDDQLARVADTVALRQRAAALEARIRELGSRRARVPGPGARPLNTYDSLRIAENMENPIFVECRAGQVVFHPSGKVKTVADVNPGSIFGSTEGHDGIILLVRPGGMRTFANCLAELEQSGLTLSYEPIDDAERLDFSGPGR